MKKLHKTQRVIATCLLMLLLLTASLQNAVAFGSYTHVSAPNATQSQMAPAVFPAVAAVAFGVVVVGAFAYGVYTGYTEASRGKEAEVISSVSLDMYQSDDFSRFDLNQAAI